MKATDKLTMHPIRQADIRAPGKASLSQLLGRQACGKLALMVSDALALAIAWKIAAQLNQRFYSPIPPQLDWGTWLGLPSLFWVFATVSLLAFAAGGLYQRSTRTDYVQAGKLVSSVYLLSLVLSYFYDPKLDAPRSLFFTAWFSSVGLVLTLRLLTTLGLRQLEQSQSQVPIFVLAPDERLPALAQAMERRSHYRVVGSAFSELAHSETTLRAILASRAQVVLAEGLPQTALASTLYWQLRKWGITLRLVPSSLETLHRRGVPEVFAGLPTLRVDSPFALLNGLDYRLKRWIDFLGAGIGLVLCAPLFVGVAIAIKVSSPGPVFFRQERMGLHGKIFQIWKFRTMGVDAPRRQAEVEAQYQVGDQVMFKLKHDPRITPVGAFLRRTSLDELPQLINVLLGQMSLVGPRPLPLRDIERFESWHHIRHQVLPGITGLWQVSGRSDIDDFSDAVRLDLYYIDNWSLNLDLDILSETLRIVLFSKGAY